MLSETDKESDDTHTRFGGLSALLWMLCSTAVPIPNCCEFKKCAKLLSEQILQLRFSFLKEGEKKKKKKKMERKGKKRKINYFFLLPFFSTTGSTLAVQLIIPLFILSYFSPFTTHIHLGLIQYYSAWHRSKTANNFSNYTISRAYPNRGTSSSKNPLT